MSPELTVMVNTSRHPSPTSSTAYASVVAADTIVVGILNNLGSRWELSLRAVRVETGVIQKPTITVKLNENEVPSRFVGVAMKQARGSCSAIAQQEPPPTPSPVGAASCSDIYAQNPSAIDGVYSIQPGDSPFKVYCRMSNGGGWTLIINHSDGLTQRLSRTPVTPDERGVLEAKQWKQLFPKLTTGLLIVDEYSRVSRIPLDRARRANCRPFSAVDLRSQQFLFHDENNGCSATGGDYTLVSIRVPSDPNGSYPLADLYQMSRMKFDEWPYSKSYSYEMQNELLIFVK